MEIAGILEIHELSSPRIIESSHSSTSSLSHLTSNHYGNGDPKTGQELVEEDAIFFKDDPQVPDVSKSSSSDPGFGEPVQADQMLTAHRRRLIQALLASFDLEKVMDRYRGDSIRKRYESNPYYPESIQTIVIINEKLATKPV